jgi:hypothetical protein
MKGEQKVEGIKVLHKIAIGNISTESARKFCFTGFNENL